MFPIIDSTSALDILLALETSAGVFIKDSFLSSLGKEVFECAQNSFATEELSALDEKTMFPTTIATLPDAKRRVIQRYVNRPLVLQNEKLLSLMKEVSDKTEELSVNILLAARDHFGWLGPKFNDLLIKDEWALNVANYPFTEGKKGQLLFPAHKDWGMMAIYPYIAGEGLEVYIDKAWRGLELPEGCLFCYAGDIFTRITDKKVPSLLHRVIQPTNEATDRTSVIFYADPVRWMSLPNGQTVGDIIDSKLKKIGQIK